MSHFRDKANFKTRFPPVGAGAEILEGAPAEASGKLADILKEKGFV